MARKIVPEGMESVKVEFWNNGKYTESKTVYVPIGEMDSYIETIESHFQAAKTMIKFKSMRTKETKTITLPFGFQHCKRILINLVKSQNEQ